MGGYTDIGSFSTPQYGWVVAKQDKANFAGFDKAAAEYKRITGKSVDPMYMQWDSNGRHLMDWYEANKGKAAGSYAPSTKRVGLYDTNIDSSGRIIDFSKKVSSNPLGGGIGNWELPGRKTTYDNPTMYGPYNKKSSIMGPSPIGKYRSPYADDFKPTTMQDFLWERGNSHDYQAGDDNKLLESTKDLVNPNYYWNPQLQRYVDGPNPSMVTFRPDKGTVKYDAAGNASYLRGGETNVQNVADYFNSNNSRDLSSYGTYLNALSTSNPYVDQLNFNKDGTQSSYYFTPYDYAISGVAGDDGSGHMANKDLSYWQNSGLVNYNNKVGFLSSYDPSGISDSNLGKENTNLRWRIGGKPGGLFGGGLAGSILSLGMSALGFPGVGMAFVNGAKAIGGMNSEKSSPDYSNISFDSEPATPSFGTGVPNIMGATTPTPNVLNPGTGGSNETTSSLNKFNWNNVDYSVGGNGLFDPKGKLAWDTTNNTGTTQLGNAYNTYLGAL